MAIAQIFAFLVNAKVDSMGGIIECGVGVDMKASPLRAAIEKAQSELRQEYDVREERRRELEFLENGGNPLDFKVGHAASISVQSTSLTDQLAEQYVTSEAKGSFALAASPHGDSVESSGRPAGSLCRESNIADNLLLFDGENSNIDGARSVKRTCKRGNASSLEQSSQIDRNVKEQDDSAIFNLGLKSQAYARRNRSRSSRDSAHVGSSDLILGHSIKPSLLPSLRPDSRDAKGLLWEKQLVDHAISSISNSKPASPNANIITKALVSADQLDMELDPVQAHACSDIIRGGVVEGDTKIKASDDLRENDPNNQQSHVVAEKVANGTTSRSSDFVGKNEAVSGSFSSAPLGSAENIKEITSAEKANGFSVPDKDVTDLHDVGLSRKSSVVDTVTEVLCTKNTKADPSHVNMSSSIAGSADVDQCSMLKRADGCSDGDSKEHSASRGIISISDTNNLGEKSLSIAVNAHIVTNDESKSVHPNVNNSLIQIKDEVELCNIRTDLQSEIIPLNNTQSVKLNRGITLKLERIQDNSFGDSSSYINKVGIIKSALVVPSCEPANATLSKRSSTTTELQNPTATRVKVAKKAHEDAILKEARIIEANIRRAGDLSMSTISSEKSKKCHWDFVLEEMAWMANDFKQERVWKTTAAAQVCHWIASSGRLKFDQENMRRKQRSIARTLAKAIMHFWHSAEVFRTSGEEPTGAHNSDLFKPWKVNRADSEKDQDSNHEEAENSVQILQPAVHGYAIRFLDYISCMSTQPILAEAPTTPDRINDAGIIETSSEDQHSEESLFYVVPPGAMQAYRESVESQWVRSKEKKTGNNLNEEDCEASMCDSFADDPREITYEEDEGETGSYFLPRAFEGNLSSKFAHKKRKHLEQKSYAARLYESSDLSYEHCVEGKSGNQSLIFTGKRPSSTLNLGSVPTKRVRTAARQRVVSPFSAGVTGSLQVTSKTDVSSGETDSFQDEQSSLHVGSQARKKMEVESTADFERQFPFDGCEISSKSKKKKKPKHLGYKNSFDSTDCGVLVVSGKASMYEQRLQLDSMIPHEQRNHVKKRLESQHFDSNGNSGHYGQHAIKKPKLLKQLPETSPEAFTPANGSMPSPVASQMSNMSSPNKLIKLIANRDRGRKSKTMKLAPGQSGSGNPWSNFEDQALVVLVHDMGTNWELVSDAINSTLQFKCIFRKPSECKERHKFLMDRNTGDGADSAEDSGSSQPYPSTLPGIPKGSARQLFQRLQGPMEEDTLKSHFEKIILIGQKLHACRSQGPKQITPAHESHVVALSHVCPNNLGGGVLTPLDLCDAITLSPDVITLGYQGSHTSGLAIPSNIGSVLPNSSASIMLQGSPSMVLGNSLPSPSTPLNGPARDAQRYAMPRPTSLPGDDQQRVQQYNQLPSGRNIPQSGMPVPGSVPMGGDPGVRMLPGGNGMGMMRGGNRGMPIPSPGFQAASPPGMRNIVSPGNMRPGRGVGMPNPVNVHSSAASSPGNSMLRSRAALQMLQTGQNTEEHRQMMMQELQLQVSQGNGQSVVSFNGISAPFSNATVSPPVQSFPVQHHQQSHQRQQQPHMHANPHHPHIQATNHSSPQQEAYALRFAKERQLQQRIMPQSQHPFSSSNAMPPIQNSYQIQQQAQSSSPGTPIPSSQVRHKQQEMTQNPQAGNGMPNPMMKQRQCQQVQHQHPRLQQQQRQQSQQAKLPKGLARGAMLMHQNLPVESSHVGGLSTASKNQIPEKHLMQQGQGFFPDSSVLNPTLPQPSNQPKMFSRPFPQTSKQMPPMPSHSDNPNQGSVQVSPNHTLLTPQQPPVPSSLPLPTQQQLRQTNQSQQNVQRIVLQQNCQMNPEGRMQPSTNQVQVNQMIPITSISPCTDSSAPAASSANQWKPEPSYDASKPTPTAHLVSLPQENFVGTETLVPSSSHGLALAQRQFSGSVPLHKHGIGGQWEKQQQPQQQPQHQHQHQHRQAAQQGNLYVLPSNSGPG